MVDAICPKCGNKISGPSQMAGRVTQCSQCGLHLMMPKPRTRPHWTNRPRENTTNTAQSKTLKPLSHQAAEAPQGNRTRRRYVRHTVEFPVRIRPISGTPYGGPHGATTFDLSGGGAGLISDNAYPVRSTLDLEISLPKPIGKVAVTAEVIHARQLDQKNFLGCEFLGADPGLSYIVNEALALVQGDSPD